MRVHFKGNQYVDELGENVAHYVSGMEINGKWIITEGSFFERKSNILSVF